MFSTLFRQGVRAHTVSVLLSGPTLSAASYVRAASLTTVPAKHAQKNTREFDIAIVGGGLVGLATARELLLRHGADGLRVCVLEKESKIAQHQSSHNSGVIHAGIYYAPGSQRAKLCVEGMARTYEFCDKYKVPYDKCGKLIVAVTAEELPRLKALYERGKQNGVPNLRMVTPREIQQIEPHIRGLAGIYSPETGIIDWEKVAIEMCRQFKEAGGQVKLNFEANGFDETSDGKISIRTAFGQSVSAQNVITCAGLYSDRVAALTGGQSDPLIAPFRGDFLKLKDEYTHLVNGLVYPVPNPAFPFLGVHFTKTMKNGEVWLGPNAVLATAREGYSWTKINLADIWSYVQHKGFRKLVFKHWKFGVGEFYRDVVMSAFVENLKAYMPTLSTSHTERGPSGVRAQALAEDGSLVEDFVFETNRVGTGSAQVIHVRNAPSPAATASLAIGRVIANRAEETFKLPNKAH